MHAYLEDLAGVGYGKDKSAVARRFIENAVTQTLETRIIPTRKATELDSDNETPNAQPPTA